VLSLGVDCRRGTVSHLLVFLDWPVLAALCGCDALASGVGSLDRLDDGLEGLESRRAARGETAEVKRHVQFRGIFLWPRIKAPKHFFRVPTWFTGPLL